MEYVRSKPASGIVASDCFTSVTATFQVLYLFVPIEIGTRRILHVNVIQRGEWTRQQFREFLDGEHGYRYISMIATLSSQPRLTKQ